MKILIKNTGDYILMKQVIYRHGECYQHEYLKRMAAYRQIKIRLDSQITQMLPCLLGI